MKLKYIAITGIAGLTLCCQSIFGQIIVIGDEPLGPQAVKIISSSRDCPASGTTIYSARDLVKIVPGANGANTKIGGTCSNNASIVIKADATITPVIMASPLFPGYDAYLNTAPVALTSAELATGIPGGCIQGTEGVSPMGGATYQIPFALPAGANNVKPDVALTYNSQSSNGIAGWGWALSGLSTISRSGQNLYFDNNKTAVDLSANDKFNFNGNRMLNKSGTYGADGTTYETEAVSFSVITSHGTSGTGPQSFDVITKDGTKIEFGTTADSRLLAVNDGSNVVSWMLKKITDINGNTIVYNYL